MQAIRQKAETRMLGIDAARGMAMLFSCLAHFGWWIERTYPGVTGALSAVGMIATPTFLLLSGTVTGWLFSSAAGNPQDTQWKLLNRGLFLLTLGHVLVSLAEAHRDGLVRAFSGATIIDDIGLCMLCCALWFGAIQKQVFRRSLVGYGVAGYVLCWLLILAWHPPVGGWLMLRQALLGVDPLGATMQTYSSPLLPYMSLFAIGLGSSDYMIASAQANSSAQGCKPLLTFGCALMLAAVLLRGLRWLMEMEFAGAGFLRPIGATLTIGGKLPPAPAYVLFYCGAGLIVSSAMFAAASSRLHILRKGAALTAVLGRASLFVFILQYFVFWTLPDLLGISPSSSHLAVIFIAGLGVNWLAAWCWNRMRGNRLLTLGIRPSRRSADGERIVPHSNGGGMSP